MAKQKDPHHPKVFVQESNIHGMGLFARRAIKKGELIDKVSGKPTRRDGPHVLWLDEGKGFKVECLMKYINHNNRPNACYYDDLTVVAIKNIKKGEEITHYYGEDWGQ